MNTQTKVRYLPLDKISKNSISVVSPFTGNVYSIEKHPEAIFSHAILGPGIMVELSCHKIVSPFDGILLEVKNAGSEFVLQANNGIKVLINIHFSKLENKTHYAHIAQIRHRVITQGQRLANLELRKLKQPLLATLTILNAPLNSELYYSHTHVDAGIDTLLTLIKK